MTDTPHAAPPGGLTEKEFFDDRLRFWHGWNKFVVNNIILLVFLLLYLVSGYSGGFSFGNSLLFVIACAAVFLRGLLTL